MSIFFEKYDTPLGSIIISEKDDQITRICFSDSKNSPGFGNNWKRGPGTPLLDSAYRQVVAYLFGDLRNFTIPIALSGTPFQRHIWEILKDIPYGTTVSYREISRLAGRDDRSNRAVARTIGQNPVMLVIPCHRVIGSDGSLVGYAGGLDRKKAFLEMERRFRDRLQSDRRERSKPPREGIVK